MLPVKRSRCSRVILSASEGSLSGERSFARAQSLRLSRSEGMTKRDGLVFEMSWAPGWQQMEPYGSTLLLDEAFLSPALPRSMRSHEGRNSFILPS